jgi:hypothetical protein
MRPEPLVCTVDHEVQSELFCPVKARLTQRHESRTIGIAGPSACTASGHTTDAPRSARQARAVLS